MANANNSVRAPVYSVLGCSHCHDKHLGSNKHVVQIIIIMIMHPFL